MRNVSVKFVEKSKHSLHILIFFNSFYLGDDVKKNILLPGGPQIEIHRLRNARGITNSPNTLLLNM